MSNFYPNAEQRGYMKYLRGIPPEELCFCGWFKLGACSSCDPSKTAADSIKEKELLEEWAAAHNSAEGHSSVSNGFVVWCKECKPDFPRGKIIQSLRDWKEEK